jgi:hypothetical protein
VGEENESTIQGKPKTVGTHQRLGVMEQILSQSLQKKKIIIPADNLTSFCDRVNFCEFRKTSFWSL